MRRFSIADIMIIIPAAAVGALILRAYLPGHAHELRIGAMLGVDPSGSRRLFAWVRGPGSCLVVPLMAAVIVMRLRRPRPRRSRLAGQPGFVACLAVMAALVPGLVWAVTIAHRPGFQQVEGFRGQWGTLLWWADTAVVGSWLALAIARRWRPERSWIDRTGRALGLYWVLLFTAALAIPWIERIQQLLAQGGLP